MAPILTAEDVVRRISAECAFVDERGGVGIRPRPAAAIVRQYGSNSASRAAGKRAGHRNRRLCSGWVLWIGRSRTGCGSLGVNEERAKLYEEPARP